MRNCTGDICLGVSRLLLDSPLDFRARLSGGNDGDEKDLKRIPRFISLTHPLAHYPLNPTNSIRFAVSRYASSTHSTTRAGSGAYSSSIDITPSMASSFIAWR